MQDEGKKLNLENLVSNALLVLAQVEQKLKSRIGDPLALLKLAQDSAAEANLDPSLLSEIYSLCVEYILEKARQFVNDLPPELKMQVKTLILIQKTCLKSLMISRKNTN